MNKCDEDDEHEDAVDYYEEARKQSGAENLPDLTEATDSVLLVHKQRGVKKQMKEEALKAA